MRGTVLLLAGLDSCAVYAEHLRANGLLVYGVARPEDALRQVDIIAPEVVVTVFSRNSSPSVIRDLRNRVDHATSIIVASSREDRRAAHGAGADSVLLMPVLPDNVLYKGSRAPHSASQRSSSSAQPGGRGLEAQDSSPPAGTDAAGPKTCATPHQNCATHQNL